MKEADKTRAIILLIILIAIGGIVMYGGEKTPSSNYATPR